MFIHACSFCNKGGPWWRAHHHNKCGLQGERTKQKSGIIFLRHICEADWVGWGRWCGQGRYVPKCWERQVEFGSFTIAYSKLEMETLCKNEHAKPLDRAIAQEDLFYEKMKHAWMRGKRGDCCSTSFLHSSTLQVKINVQCDINWAIQSMGLSPGICSISGLLTTNRTIRTAVLLRFSVLAYIQRPRRR